MATIATAGTVDGEWGPRQRGPWNASGSERRTIHASSSSRLAACDLPPPALAVLVGPVELLEPDPLGVGALQLSRLVHLRRSEGRWLDRYHRCEGSKEVWGAVHSSQSRHAPSYQGQRQGGGRRGREGPSAVPVPVGHRPPCSFMQSTATYSRLPQESEQSPPKRASWCHLVLAFVVALLLLSFPSSVWLSRQQPHKEQPESKQTGVMVRVPGPQGKVK